MLSGRRRGFKRDGQILMTSITKNIRNWLIFILILFFTWFLWRSVTGYAGLVPWCNIKIHGDILRGNESTIKRAIASLRKTDKPVYKNLCANIDHIYERYCLGSDWNLTSPLVWMEKPGCYVKGTHAIYITPRKQSSYSQIIDLSKDLKIFSGHAKEFWDGN